MNRQRRGIRQTRSKRLTTTHNTNPNNHQHNKRQGSAEATERIDQWVFSKHLGGSDCDSVVDGSG